MTKAQILKQTGLTEQEFYKLYPTQQHYQMAMGGRLYANGGGLPPDEGTSYVQYDEAGNPITANQMYSNKNSLNLREFSNPKTTTNWTQDNENAKLEDLQSLKRQKEALEYNLQNSQNEVSKSRIKDELNAVNDKINHWETYGVSKPKEGLYYESNDGMNYSELGMRNEGMHYSEKDIPESFDDMSFNSAFGAARKQGLKKFTWKGKSYGTNLKGESTKSSGKIPPPVVSEIKGAPRRMAFGGNLRTLYPDGGTLPFEHTYKGRVYIVDPTTKTVKDKKTGTDATKMAMLEFPDLIPEDTYKPMYNLSESNHSLNNNRSFITQGFNDGLIAERDWNRRALTLNGSGIDEYMKNEETYAPYTELQDSIDKTKSDYYKGVNKKAFGGGIGDEEPRPVVHTGTANNKTWLRQGLDYLGNLGVQDFSNNIQDIFFNPNKGVKLDRTNPNVGTNIPTVKNYNSSNINPLYVEQYADGGNLAGNLDQQGIQNEQMNSETVNVSSFGKGIMGLGNSIANTLGLGSLVSSSIDSLGSKAGIKGSKAFNTGMGVGTGLTTVASMAAGIAGMPGVSGSNNEFDPNKTTGNSLTGGAGSSAGDLLNNQAYGGRLNFAAGGALTEINTGGTHEQNPMGGVMVGRNASVEQGEALINKDGKPAFVLTDRIKLDSTTAEEFGLPKKYIGKTFSDIGKAENRVSDLRPNDPLTKDLLKSRNEKLEAAQEAQKARMAEKHMAKAQELAPEMFQQAQPQGMPQEQMAMQDPAMEQMMAMQGQGMPQGMPQQPMMASGGSLNFKSSGAYNKWLGYVHANKLAENTPGHQKVSIGGEPHRVQHGYGGVMQYPYGGPFDPIEPVMMNTNVYPTIPSIQNVPIVSDPNALRDLQQRDRSIDATLNWEKNNGYNNYGFTSEPAGSINSLGQAHEKFMDNYQPMIDDLPMGLQGLAGDFAFNSEDPRASLMVSQGYLTPEEKVALYKKGKLDNTAVDKLWATHGTNVINDFNRDRVAFANKFDAERLRSYKNTKGADEKLPEWTRRVADSRNASGIPRSNPYLQPNTNTNTTNSKAVVDPLNPGGQSYTNPYRQSTVRDLFVGPQLQNQQGPPYTGPVINNNINPDPNATPTPKLKDILLSDTKIPKDRTGLKAAILGTQAAMEAARLASTEKPVDFRNVQYTQVNPYISQAIMQANKNNDIANYRDVLRNAGASQAQYIGNATQTFPAMSADYASKIAMLRYQADQANNQIANTEEQTNQAIGAQNIERRAQGQANLSNQLLCEFQFGSDLQNTLPIITEKEKRDMQLATMGLMNTPQYKYVMDEKTGRLKKFFHPTDPGLQNTTANIQTDAEGNKYIFNTTTETWNKIGAYGGKIAKKKFGGSMKNC